MACSAPREGRGRWCGCSRSARSAPRTCRAPRTSAWSDYSGGCGPSSLEEVLRVLHESDDGGQMWPEFCPEVNRLAGDVQDPLAAFEDRRPVPFLVGLLGLDC